MFFMIGKLKCFKITVTTHLNHKKRFKIITRTTRSNKLLLRNKHSNIPKMSYLIKYTMNEEEPIVTLESLSESLSLRIIAEIINYL